MDNFVPDTQGTSPEEAEVLSDLIDRRTAAGRNCAVSDLNTLHELGGDTPVSGDALTKAVKQ